ncbi:S-phase kinase-associated protein 2 [Bienertia sinuspersici]
MANHPMNPYNLRMTHGEDLMHYVERLRARCTISGRDYVGGLNNYHTALRRIDALLRTIPNHEPWTSVIAKYSDVLSDEGEIHPTKYQYKGRWYLNLEYVAAQLIEALEEWENDQKENLGAAIMNNNNGNDNNNADYAKKVARFPQEERITAAAYYLQGEADIWRSASQTELVAQPGFDWDAFKTAMICPGRRNGDSGNNGDETQTQGNKKRRYNNQGQNSNWGKPQGQGKKNGKKQDKHYYCKLCRNNHPGVDYQGKPVQCFGYKKMGHREFKCYLR